MSLANPWLDFLSTATTSSTSGDDSESATLLAQKLNDDVAEMCAKHPARLSGFSILPTTAGGDACAAEVVRSAGVTVKNAAAGGAEVPNTFRPLRGVILGTSGVKGLGLDSLEMEPVYAALEKTKMVLFIHPHYGLRGEDLSKYGHSLELALGFPMETSIAIARLICSGVLDRFPELKVHVAHAGGVLPYLQGRLDSCVEYFYFFRLDIDVLALSHSLTLEKISQLQLHLELV